MFTSNNQPQQSIGQNIVVFPLGWKQIIVVYLAEKLVIYNVSTLLYVVGTCLLCQIRKIVDSSQELVYHKY